MKYAIHISEDNLDLIQVLNGGVRPKLEEKPTYFLLDAIPPTTTENHDIKFEDDLYDENGVAKEIMTWL